LFSSGALTIIFKNTYQHIVFRRPALVCSECREPLFLFGAMMNLTDFFIELVSIEKIASKIAEIIKMKLRESYQWPDR
jgi:hypothetical protein